MRLRWLVAVLASATIWSVPAQAEDRPPGSNPKPQSVRLPGADSAKPGQSYDLQAVRAGRARVPAQLPRKLPARLAEAGDAQARKQLFLKKVLPAVLTANAQVRSQRQFVQQVAWLKQQGARLSSRVRSRLRQLAEVYELEPGDLAGLQRRVDTLPPSLMLAQAAIESGWGSSRFAQNGNALFGQRNYHCEGCGMQPNGYEDDPGFRVADFPTVAESVQAYLRNINTHPAYAGLRKARAAAREAARPLDGLRLAQHLTRYSERGQAYVRDVQTTIRANRLTEFDQAELVTPPQLARLVD